jgi:hypothetical protein
MRFLTKVSALAFAALAAVPATNAAPESSLNVTNPTQVVDSAVAEDLAQIVREVNGQDVQVREANGKKGITFKDGDIPYTMAPVFCDILPGKCLGFVMVVVVDNSELKFTLDTLNSANKSTSFLTFFKEENNKFTVGRVTLVDGGVSRKNIAINISVCAMEFREAMKRLQSQLTAGFDRGTPYQRASYGPARWRAYAPSPDYAASLADKFAPEYARRFGRR